MRKISGKILTLVLFLGLGIFLVWLVTHNLTPEQWEQIREAFREADYWMLVPVLVIGFFGQLFRALRWRLFLLPMGYKPGVYSTFCAVIIGLLANLALPRVGEIMRCGILSRNDNIPFNKILGTIISERAIDVVCLALLLLVTVLMQIDLLGQFFYDMVVVRFMRIFERENILAGIIVLVSLVLIGVLLRFFLKRSKNTRWYIKFKVMLQGIKNGILSVGKIKRKRAFFLYTLGIWLSYFFMVYVGFYCLKPTAVLGLKPALSVLGFGSIGMIITQGGIGAYQLIVEKTLSLYGIANAYGYAFGWLSWLAQTVLILFLGVVSMASLPFIRRRKKLVAPLPTADIK